MLNKIVLSLYLKVACDDYRLYIALAYYPSAAPSDSVFVCCVYKFAYLLTYFVFMCAPEVQFFNTWGAVTISFGGERGHGPIPGVLVILTSLDAYTMYTITMIRSHANGFISKKLLQEKNNIFISLYCVTSDKINLRACFGYISILQ